MARITVEDCMQKIDNQYDLVLLAKERTSQLNSGSPMLVEEDNDKKTIIALREIGDGKVSVKELEKNAITRLRKEPDEAVEQELADAGKPVISESIVSDLIAELESVFADTISNIDTSDLSPEFGLNYNEVYLESLELDNIGVDTNELQVVFEQFFAIKDDEELEQDDNS